jgi:hypothetical protein
MSKSYTFFPPAPQQVCCVTALLLLLLLHIKVKLNLQTLTETVHCKRIYIRKSISEYCLTPWSSVRTKQNIMQS